MNNDDIMIDEIVDTGETFREPPPCLTILRNLLLNEDAEVGHPTELDITILPIDNEDDAEDEGGSMSGMELSNGGQHEAVHYEQQYPQRAFRLVDGKLGIHAPDVPRIAKEIRDYYNCLRQRLLLHLGDSYTKQIDGQGSKRVRWKLARFTHLLHVTSCVVLLCPEHATAWGDRRTAILAIYENGLAKSLSKPSLCSNSMPHEGKNTIHNKQDYCRRGDHQTEDLWTNEMQFLNFLFTMHAKKSSAWAYRKWVYHKFIDSLLLLKSLKLLNHPTTTTNLSLTTTITTTQQEEFNNIQEHLSILIKWVINENQTITSKVIKSFPKNYYAWTYLLYIAQSLKDLALASCYTTSNVISCGNIRKEEARNVTVIVGQVQIFLTMQVSFVVPWLQRHVSDHSASHYGSMVLRMLITFMLEVANKCENNVNYKKNTNGVDATKTPPLEKNDQVLQNLQHYGGTTKKKKEAAVECVLRIIEQELRKVGELLQLYPSHEALWLYRRQCSIIFLDVVHKELTVLGRGISASKLQYCTASDVHIMLRDCLRNFFQKEISFVLSNDDTATTKKSQQPQSLEDGVNIKFHQLTYIAWIYYHVRRNGLNEELAKHCNQKGDWEEKQFEKMRGVVTRLQSIDSIPHNLWRHSSLL